MCVMSVYVRIQVRIYQDMQQCIYVCLYILKCMCMYLCILPQKHIIIFWVAIIIYIVRMHTYTMMCVYSCELFSFLF